MRLVIGRVYPDFSGVGPCKAGHFQAHQSYLVHKGKIAGDEFRKFIQYGDGMPLHYDPDLDPLVQSSEVKDSVDGFLECSLGLDDEIMQASLGPVYGYSGHDVGVADCRVPAGGVPLGPEPSGLLLLTGEALKLLTGLTVISLGEGDCDGVGDGDDFAAE